LVLFCLSAQPRVTAVLLLSFCAPAGKLPWRLFFPSFLPCSDRMLKNCFMHLFLFIQNQLPSSSHPAICLPPLFTSVKYGGFPPPSPHFPPTPNKSFSGVSSLPAQIRPDHLHFPSFPTRNGSRVRYPPFPPFFFARTIRPGAFITWAGRKEPHISQGTLRLFPPGSDGFPFLLFFSGQDGSVLFLFLSESIL